MFTRQFNQHGSESYRDRSFKEREGYHLGNRLVEYAHEILSIEPFASRRDRGSGTSENTLGDILGPVFIQTKTPGDTSPEARPVGSWWHGAPVIVKDLELGDDDTPTIILCVPIANELYEEDLRYEPVPVFVKKGITVSKGDIGILNTATKEDGEPEFIFTPSGGAGLLAPNLRGADFTRGTYVYDLEGEEGDEPSEEYKAQLQTAWRVMRPVFGKEGTTETIFGVPSEERGLSTRIAIQLGFAQDGESAPCMGLMVDQDTGAGSTIGGVTPLVAGFFGIKAGGPLFAGESTAEKHKLEPAGTGSETRDGETQCAGHVGTCTFFKTPGGGKFFDAPLAFRPETFPRVPDMPFPMQTKLLYRLDAKHLFRGREEDHVWDWVSFYDFGGSHDDPTGSDGGTGDGTGGAGSGSEDPPPGGGVETPVDPPDKPTEPRIPPEPPEVFCAGHEGLARKEKITPTLAKFRGNEDPHLMHKSYRYTPYHMAYTGILAKGNPSIIGEYSKDFTDYTRQASKKDIDLYRDTTPISGQLISYAGHAENPFIAEYTQTPESVDGKYLAGTASGGFILMQPELDLAGFREVIDGIVSVSDLYSATLSQTRLTFAPEARLAFGVPGLNNGALHDGWNLRKQYSDSKLILTRETGGAETENGYFKDNFSHAFGEGLRNNADYSAAYGKQAWTFIKGERAFGIGKSGDTGDHQHSEYMMHGALASGTASVSLDIDGDDFTFPSEDSAWLFMAETSIRSSSTSALNPDAIFVSRDEFAINVTAGTAALVGAVTNHFSQSEFTGGGASISIAFSIASGNILRASVSKTGTDDVEVTCYLTATQCRNS